jgi:hypothetical protein
MYLLSAKRLAFLYGIYLADINTNARCSSKKTAAAKITIDIEQCPLELAP